MHIGKKKQETDYKIQVIRRTRELIPDLPLLMVAGGREGIFEGAEKSMFEAGVNAIVLGDYLTTPGATPERDRELIISLGYKVATACNDS